MQNEELTPELLEKARSAKSPDELLALAKDNGIELTAEEADTYYSQLNPQTAELSDDELDNVAGGGCSKVKCSHCGSNDVEIAEVLFRTAKVRHLYKCRKCGNTFIN